MKMKLVCNGKKCRNCRKHFKEWKNAEKKRLLHNFMNHWVELRGKELTNTVWWEEFCLDWCEHFGYDGEMEFNRNIVKEFPFFFSRNKSKLFFDEKWSDFSKCYTDYFYWVK
jgi:hypothetical protein